MKPSGLALFLPLIVSLLFTTDVLGNRYQLDEQHSQIIFSAEHLGFTTSYGRFRKLTGDFEFDEQDWNKSRVSIVISAKSIDMGHSAWNKHMRSYDFFNVEQHPEITFESTAIEKTGENTGTVTGELTMVGKTRSMSFPFTLNKVAKHPLTRKVHAGFSARLVLKRSEFEINYGIPAVSDEVAIILELDGVRTE